MNAAPSPARFEVANQVPENIVVSVMILTYNQADYIAGALDGALMQQTDFPYEICIGEDGSEDGTREICQQYADRHPDRIRLFLRDRSRVQGLTGYQAAMLNGTETRDACRGRYIAICDGDDYWTDPDKLKTQVDHLDAHPNCAMSFHPVRQMWPDGSFMATPRAQHREHDGQLPARAVLLGGGHYVPTSATVYRRSALYEQLPAFLANAEVGDLPTQIILASRGDVMFFARTMSVYRRHAPGSWSDTQQQAHARTQHFAGMFELWQQLIDFLPWRLKPFAGIRAAYETFRFAQASGSEQTSLLKVLGRHRETAAPTLLQRLTFRYGRLRRPR